MFHWFYFEGKCEFSCRQRLDFHCLLYLTVHISFLVPKQKGAKPHLEKPLVSPLLLYDSLSPSFCISTPHFPNECYRENAKLYRRPKPWSHLAGAVFRSKSFLTSDPSSANKRGLHSDTSPVPIFSLFVCVGDNQSAPTVRYFTVIDDYLRCFDLVRLIPSMFSVVTVRAGRLSQKIMSTLFSF